MWKWFDSRAMATKYAEHYIRSRSGASERDITFEQPGWYWCEVLEQYVTGGCYSRVLTIVPASERASIVADQIRELASDLREARQKMRKNND